MIKNIAKKFYNIEREDLFQAGRLGLIKAYNNYKEENGSFNTYAYKYIFGEMYELTMKSQNIKVNKSYLKLTKLVIQTRNMLEQKYGCEVSLEDISSYLEIPLNEIEYSYILSQKMISLDDEYNKVDIVYNEMYDTNLLIHESLNQLDKLSSEVIKYRYVSDLTQMEVAKKLGISQVKVSRIEKKSKEKILEYIS